MPLTPAKYVPSDTKTTIIEILSYEHKNPVGILRNPYYGREVSFGSATELLLAIDNMLDSLACPQAAMASRRFRSKTTMLLRTIPRHQKTPLSVFKLNVVFRQNASWQGSLTWVDQAEQMPFRSVFELLKLIDSVMSPNEQAGIQAGSK